MDIEQTQFRIEQLESLLRKANEHIEEWTEQVKNLAGCVKGNSQIGKYWESSADFQVSLIVVNDVGRNNQSGLVDETRYVSTLAEAQKLEAEILKRKEVYKRKILIAQQYSIKAVLF